MEKKRDECRLLIAKRSILNSWLDGTELRIMDKIIHGEDPTEDIYYREHLKSRLHDLHETIKELL